MIPAAAVAYAIALAIAIALFFRFGRDVLTVQGFWISMATQLVGVLLFGLDTGLTCGMVHRGDAIGSVGCIYTFVYGGVILIFVQQESLDAYPDGASKPFIRFARDG